MHIFDKIIKGGYFTMYQYRVNWFILLLIFIALFFIMGIIIGVMGKNKKVWIISLILLVIYILLVNPRTIFIWALLLIN